MVVDILVGSLEVVDNTAVVEYDVDNHSLNSHTPLLPGFVRPCSENVRSWVSPTPMLSLDLFPSELLTS